MRTLFQEDRRLAFDSHYWQFIHLDISSCDLGLRKSYVQLSFVNTLNRFDCVHEQPDLEFCIAHDLSFLTLFSLRVRIVMYKK